MLEKRVSTNGKIYTNIINLTQWDKNPRAIYEKDIMRLKIQIATLGQYKPLFVTSDGIMVGGNMRLPNMLWLNENILEWDDEKGNHYSIDKRGQFTEVWITELGFVEVASPDGSTRYRATLDGKVQEKIFGSIEQMMIEYAISDNDGAGFYEQQKLAKLIHPYQELIDTSNYKLALSPEVSMKTFLDEFQPSDGPDLPTTVEDEAPEVNETEAPISKEGEVYQLGRHRLMCGSSTDLDHMATLMNGVKAQMVFTDPPYLMGFEGNVHADGSKSFNAMHGAIKNDKMSKEDGDQFIFDMFTSIRTFTRGAFYVCFYRLGLEYIFRALDKQNMQYRSLIIWNKGVHTLSNSDYMSKYEPIVYGWVEEHNFFRDSEFDIWDVQRTAKNDLHPTMKPIELCARAIRNSSKAGDIILDLFAGSGSTLIAAEQTDRSAYVMELDPKYCDVIRKRYAKFMGQENSWEALTPVIVSPQNPETIVPDPALAATDVANYGTTPENIV